MRKDCEKFIIIVAAQFLNDENVTNNKMKIKRNRKKMVLKIEKQAQFLLQILVLDFHYVLS